jgi:hypothetical protein
VVLELLSGSLNQIFRLRRSYPQPNLKFEHPTPKTIDFICEGSGVLGGTGFTARKEDNFNEEMSIGHS